MKNLKHIIAICAIIIASNATATVRTLNNNNPSPGQYQAWIFVQGVLAAGDTVYVSGSPISYGDITISLYNITIIGTGFNPQKQNPQVSEFGSITIDDYVGDVSIIGVKCLAINKTTNFGTTILRVSSCLIKLGISTTDHGFDTYYYLKNNIIGYSNIPSGSFISANVDVNAFKGELNNNIFFGKFDIYGSLISEVNQCNMFNNIFFSLEPLYLGNQLFYGSGIPYKNSIFDNNILLGINNSGINISSTVTCHNNVISTGSTITLPNATSTLNCSPGQIFVYYPCVDWSCAFNLTNDFHLQPGSPFIGAGTNGTDVGVYGGPYGAKFTMSGEPPIPQMRQMNMPTQVVSGSSFSVNIISTTKAP